MKKILAQKQLTYLFSYMLQVLTKKSTLKPKDFFTLCIYPSLEKKDILSTFSKLCYCRQKNFICLMQYHPEILKIFLDNKGQMKKYCTVDLQADLQLLPTSS